MSKAYTMVRLDIADSAAAVTFLALAENAPNYGIGTTIVSADGARTVVISEGVGKLVTVAA
jgi:hypothetical protein